MKNLTQLIISFCLFTIVSFQVKSQTPITPLGQISLDEMSLNEYEKDKNAEAVVLFDYGQSKFRYTDGYGFKIHFTRHFRIKVLSSAGLDYGEIEIPIYQENNVFEKVEKIEGYTYSKNEKGGVEITKLDPKGEVYKENIGEGWFLSKFAMPNVKVGSVIEVKYTIISPYLFNLNNWEFQRSIPTIYSEYAVSIIPFYTYAFILQGANRFDFNTSRVIPGDNTLGSVKYKEMENRYVMKDVPAFKDEKFISGRSDYIMKIVFQLESITNLSNIKKDIITTWPQLIKDLIKESAFGGYIKSSQKKSKEIIQNLSLDGLSEKDKIKKITNYVKSNYNWDGYNRRYANDSPKQFLKIKTGNSAEINLFLVALLREAGIAADPIILSTRGSGKIFMDYPFAHYFNYVIAYAGSAKKQCLDATESILPYNELPMRCFNGKGLIVKDDVVAWVNIQNTVMSVESMDFNISIDTVENNLSVNYTNQSKGFNAYHYRRLALEEKIKEKFEPYVDEFKSEITTKNTHDPDKKMEITFDYTKAIEGVDQKIYINPFLNFALSTNPFDQTKRSLPIDLVYKKNKIFSSKIIIPEGYKVVSLPQGIDTKSKYMQVFYNARLLKSNEIEVKAKYSYTKANYAAEDYRALKFTNDKIIDRFNEYIVLEKL